MPDMLYYFGSEKPMSGSGEGWMVYCCLPLSYGMDCHRYANLVVLSHGYRPGDFMEDMRTALPHSYQWLGYFTED